MDHCVALNEISKASTTEALTFTVYNHSHIEGENGV